jgi:hypothetical protein
VEQPSSITTIPRFLFEELSGKYGIGAKREKVFVLHDQKYFVRPLSTIALSDFPAVVLTEEEDAHFRQAVVAVVARTPSQANDLAHLTNLQAAGYIKAKERKCDPYTVRDFRAGFGSTHGISLITSESLWRPLVAELFDRAAELSKPFARKSRLNGGA